MEYFYCLHGEGTLEKKRVEPPFGPISLSLVSLALIGFQPIKTRTK